MTDIISSFLFIYTTFLRVPTHRIYVCYLLFRIYRIYACYLLFGISRISIINKVFSRLTCFCFYCLFYYKQKASPLIIIAIIIRFSLCPLLTIFVFMWSFDRFIHMSSFNVLSWWSRYILQRNTFLPSSMHEYPSDRCTSHFIWHFSVSLQGIHTTASESGRTHLLYFSRTVRAEKNFIPVFI